MRRHASVFLSEQSCATALKSGWRKLQHRCGRRLSPTRLCWPPSNSHCRTGTRRTGFSLLRLRPWT